MHKYKTVLESHKTIDQPTKKWESDCIAHGSERSKFEQFKADSQYLREPLVSELENKSDHFSNDGLQLLKFHGSYQQDDRDNRKKGEGKDWQMMLRLRAPGGSIPGGLFLALDDLSNKFGNKTLRATTRQAFQMHGIRKDSLKEVIGTIIKSMGSTLAACGDISRNVMAPAAPYSKGGYPAARELANSIADLLAPEQAEGSYLDLWVDGDLSYRIQASKKVLTARNKQTLGAVFSGDSKEPLYGSTYLPRKFKCAVTVPGDNSVDIYTHDIGLVAFTNLRGELKGCNVYIGGGMGRTHNNEQTFARMAEPLGYVLADDVLELIQAILAVQRDYGNRKSRRNSRMKYLINEMGIEWFKEQLTIKYYKKNIYKIRYLPKFELKDYLGWNKQSEKLCFVGIPLLSGRLKGEVKHGIREIVERYKLNIKLTPNQDLILSNIGNYQKSSIQRELKSIGINTEEDVGRLERVAIACPALPLCGLAMTEAERILPNVLLRINNLLKGLEIDIPILIRMTGCPNGCARPYMAEMALVGSGNEYYQLWLGGTPSLDKLAKPYIQRMHIDNLEETIKPLLISWKETGLKISFGAHINNLGEKKVISFIN